jgi:hypothetical protein
MLIMSIADPPFAAVPARVALGAIAGPLFVSALTVIGARFGYDWRRHAVSSLAIGSLGWLQRSNFVLTGSLYLIGASGLRRCPRRIVGPALVPVLVGAAGVGLIGSGVFVTDPVGDFPPPSTDGGNADTWAPARVTPSRSGTLHNLSAIPIFIGIPLAGAVSALSAARSGKFRWAGYSAASSLVMVFGFVQFGAAFGDAPSPLAKGGIFQRISIAAGFGWLSVLSLHALMSAREA